MEKKLTNINEVIFQSFNDFKERCEMARLNCSQITNIEWSSLVNAVNDNLVEKHLENELYRVISIIYSHIAMIFIVEGREINFEVFLELIENGLNAVSMYSRYKFSQADCEKIKQSMLSYAKYGEITNIEEYFDRNNVFNEISNNNESCIVYNFNDYYQKRK